MAYPGARYHVVARGTRRQKVFFDQQDCQMFLVGLARTVGQFQVELFSYCLMENHLHLYLETPHAISRFMHSLLTSYAVKFTKKRNLPWHLFQNRFWSELIENRESGQRVGRYIHLNPCRGDGMDDLPLETRRQILRTYPWSSYRAIIGLEACPAWLQRAELLLTWGSETRDREEGYCLFVERGLETGADPMLERGALPKSEQTLALEAEGSLTSDSSALEVSPLEEPGAWVDLETISSTEGPEKGNFLSRLMEQTL